MLALARPRSDHRCQLQGQPVGAQETKGPHRPLLPGRRTLRDPLIEKGPGGAVPWLVVYMLRDRGERVVRLARFRMLHGEEDRCRLLGAQATVAHTQVG